MEKEKVIEEGDYKVVCQKWEERERGWGSEPDGFSLHLSDRHREQYIQDYWDRLPDRVPESYEAPDGSPYEVGVSIKVYAELVVFGSLRFLADHRYPGSGGSDGWRPLDC